MSLSKCIKYNGKCLKNLKILQACNNLENGGKLTEHHLGIMQSENGSCLSPAANINFGHL